MAKKLCDLCNKQFADDSRFGVHLCRDCSDGYDKAMLGDPACQARFSDPANFPNATVAARKDIIAIVARKMGKDVVIREQKEKQAVPVKVQGMKTQATEVSRSAPQKRTESPDAMDALYSDIGNKIKGWAKWIFLVEAVSLGCAAVGWLFFIENAWEFFVIPLALAVGLGAALVSTWLLYAFGDLVDKTAANERNTRNILQLLQQKEK